ncbi:MAG: hypothetical protein LAN59_10285 [Acidobacteriia bacterium]|nr:hypothetical protein [Terriglobia bacterium]
MATVDDDLNQIEKDLRTLKIEYEQFFAGGRKRPPTDTQWRVETLVRRYNERLAQLRFAQRFRFNNLAQTFAKYQDMWRKKLMQKEGAVTEHHFGAAAKAIEAERAHKASSRPGGSPRTGEAARSAAEARAAFSLSFSDPAKEQEKVQELYRKVIEARAESGDKSKAPSLQDFERFVQKKTKELQDKGGRQIEYIVSVEGGRTKLKARISD